MSWYLLGDVDKYIISRREYIVNVHDTSQNKTKILNLKLDTRERTWEEVRWERIFKWKQHHTAVRADREKH